MPTTIVETFYCRNCGNRCPMDNRAWVLHHGMVCLSCKQARYTPCQGCDRIIRLPQESHSRKMPGSCFCASCQESFRTFAPTSMGEAKTFSRIKSHRSFGLELESHTDNGYIYLKMDNTSCFGAKFDCTCSGREFYSPILTGDEGLDEVTTLCRVADEQGWSVDFNCGFHLHLDMRGETLTTLRSIAYAWSQLHSVVIGCVETSRADSEYCCHHLEPNQVEMTEDLLGLFNGTDRYNFFNFQAYHVHGTFENRLHEGTFDLEAIRNWIILNLRITDVAATLPVPVLKVLFDGKTVAEKWAVLKTWVKDKDVIDFYEARMKVNTRTSRHFSH